jgi:hypothetical protein
MDRLDFNTVNTLPVYLKDFEYLQDIYKKAFEGFAHAVLPGTANENFIISGCEHISNTVTEGWIYLNGEVLYCAGATGVTAQPSGTYLFKSIAYNADGNRTAGDNNTHYAWELNRASVIWSSVPGTTYITCAGLRYADMIANMIVNQPNPAWITPPTFTTPYTNTNLKYRKVGNYLEMKGVVNNTTGIFSGNVFVIPDLNCRPIVTTKLPVIINPGTGYNAKSANLSIDTNGIIKLDSADTSGTGYADIHINIRIPLD